MECDDEWTNEYTIFNLEVLHICIAVITQIGKLQGTQLLLDLFDGIRSSDKILRAMDNLLDENFNYLKRNAAIGIFSTKLQALIKPWRVRGRYYIWARHHLMRLCIGLYME